MFNISSAMAGGFVDAAKLMTKTVDELGPNPLGAQSPEGV
jgi:coenzyme F420-reducing hydrogenase delta subunit